MKRKLSIISSILLTLALPALADTLSVSPVGQTKILGNQATVTINAAGGYVGDFDLDIGWNNTILSLFSISYGTQLGGPLDSIQNPTAGGPGTVNASEISLLLPADLMLLQPGQTATLLTLVFNTIGLGTSAVDINVVTFGDENGLTPTSGVQTQNGSITVIAPNGDVPEPYSVALLATVAGLLVRRFQRRAAGQL